MALQTPAGTGHQLALPRVAEHPAWATRGVRVLVAGVVVLCSEQATQQVVNNGSRYQ